MLKALPTPEAEAVVFWDQELWPQLGRSGAPGWWSLAHRPVLQYFGSHSWVFSPESISSTFRNKLAREKYLSTVTQKKTNQSNFVEGY